MTVRRADRVDELFDQALLHAPDERTAWLDSACAGDEALREQVVELLAAHEKAGILDGPSPRMAPAVQRRIGAYRIIRELGRGGMGVVYLGERDDGQYTRRVAVKVLRAGPDGEELQRRFLAERQILASLVHPNIAQLLDGGVTDGRLPYCVMEYVDGLPITTYCDRHRLTIGDRLRLFQDVCRAVHHAHQNLVIHRDIKPGNILVTGDGQVKLLDFGIAKLLNPGMSPVEMPVTRTEVRVMTPEYASPEQVRGDPLSTSSDVYALGVVLYEILAGRRPYRLSSTSPAELARVVCDHDPDPPSAVAGREDDGAPSAQAVSAARNTTPERLRSELRDDLDAIVLMAMRKEPGRRYASAAILGEDIERALTGMPVLAHRDTRSYRARKFLRRHRVVVAAAALVIASLIAGAGVAAWQARVAADQRDMARQAALGAENQRRQAEEVSSFLFSLFEASDPVQTRGRDGPSARDLLERGRERIAGLTGQPLVQARMMDVMARVYSGLGEYDRARELLSDALGIRRTLHGDRHVAVAATRAALGETYRRLGRYPDAIREVTTALDVQRDLLGRDHPDLAPTLMQLSGLVVYHGEIERGAALADEALAIREKAFGPNDTLVARSLLLRSIQRRRIAQYADAERDAERALAIMEGAAGTDHPLYAEALLNRAYMLIDDSIKLDQAESHFRKALAIRTRHLGPGHRSTVIILGNLAGAIYLQGRQAEADSLSEEFLARMQSILGPLHPSLAEARGFRSLELARSNRIVEGERLGRQALEEFRLTLGSSHSGYAWQLANLAEVLVHAGKLEEAERLQRDAIAIRSGNMPARANSLIGVMTAELGTIRGRRGYVAEAESLMLEGYRIALAHVPENHVDPRKIRRLLVDFYTEAGRPADANKYRF